MFGYNAQFKRCAIDGAKTLRVQRLSATTGVNLILRLSRVEHLHVSSISSLKWRFTRENFKNFQKVFILILYNTELKKSIGRGLTSL